MSAAQPSFKVPAYRVKVSPRAKYVRLKFSPAEGLVVVVPRGFDHARLDDIVNDRAAWIEKVSSRYAAFPCTHADTALPGRIELAALGETWDVTYEPSTSNSVRAIPGAHGQLRVSGKVDDKQACLRALRRWLFRHARQHLVEALEQTSQACGLAYRKASIRGQRTRWGSCSSSGTISLNAQLLFVTPGMLRYVLIHELCHTVHLDHSRAFYTLLAGYLPEHREHEAGLKQAWRSMPGWLHALQAA